jgi:hypothetical protein
MNTVNAYYKLEIEAFMMWWTMFIGLSGMHQSSSGLVVGVNGTCFYSRACH